MNKLYRKHYTLVELLLVIGVLGILVAMGAPAAVRMISKKKTTVAKQEIAAIKQAVKAYEAEYGRLPFTTGATPIEADLVTNVSSPAPPKTSEEFIKVLLNFSADATNNPRGIKFLAWIDRNDDNTADNWIDPWGNAYVIGVDYDYDGEVNLDLNGDNDASDTNEEELRVSVYIYSIGEDGIATEISDNVVSWK